MKMKYLSLTITLVLLLVTTNFSQRLTLKELIDKTGCTDVACFNKYVTVRGYCFEGSSNRNKNTGYGFFQYLSCNYIKDGPPGFDTKDRIQFGYFSTGTLTAKIETASIDYSNLLLTQINQLGFLATVTKNSDKTLTYTYYKSLNFPNITLLVEKTQVSGNQQSNYTIWEFSIKSKAPIS